MVLKQMLVNQLTDLAKLAQVNRQNGDIKQAAIYDEYIAAIEAEFLIEGTVMPLNDAATVTGQEKFTRSWQAKAL